MRLFSSILLSGSFAVITSAECQESASAFRSNVRRWIRSPETAEQDLHEEELVGFAQNIPEDCDSVTSFVAYLFVAAANTEGRSEFDLDMWAWVWENVKVSSWRRIIVDGKWPIFGLFTMLFPMAGDSVVDQVCSADFSASACDSMANNSTNSWRSLPKALIDRTIKPSDAIGQTNTLLWEFERAGGRKNFERDAAILAIEAAATARDKRGCEHAGDLLDQVQQTFATAFDFETVAPDSRIEVSEDVRVMIEALSMVEATCPVEQDGTCAAQITYHEGTKSLIDHLENPTEEQCKEELDKYERPWDTRWEHGLPGQFFQKKMIRAGQGTFTKLGSRVQNMPYFPDSILPSEAFAFMSFAEALNVTMIIESGAGYGGSLAFWCRLRYKVISIDKDFREEVGEVARKYCVDHAPTLLEGDGIIRIPQILNAPELQDERIAVFIDGPKGCKAAHLARQAEQFPNVFVVGVHDVNRKSSRYTANSCNVHSARTAIFDVTPNNGEQVFFSDRFWFVMRYAKLLDKNWEYESREDDPEHGSYGPTIAIWWSEHSAPFLIKTMAGYDDWIWDTTTPEIQEFKKLRHPHRSIIDTNLLLH